MFREFVDLHPYNTLALHARARYFCEPANPDELEQALIFAREHGLSVLPLGEGSNLILTRDYPGLVLRLVDRSLHVEQEDEVSIVIRVGAGMVWHQLVETTLARGWYGLENLALIPGTVGAAPVQNIGAYGVELSRFIVSVSMREIETGAQRILDKTQCAFAYRDSVFKQALREQVIITSVNLRLFRQPHVSADYGSLREWLQAHDIADPAPQQVFDAVCAVRRSRLPDPHVLPNAGSFFKNPQVSQEQYAALLQRFPAVVSYPGEQGRVKLAAAWLIDQLGWKGRCEGDACVHDQQALVLVNRGQASGADMLALAQQITQAVQQQFDVALELEPRVW